MPLRTSTNPPSDDGAGTPGPEHDRALEYALLRAFLKERVGFQFGVAVIDDDSARAEAIAALTAELAADGIEWLTIDLRDLPDDAVLLAEIRRRLAAIDGRPAAVGVVGIEWHLDIGNGGVRDGDKPSPLLADANFQRDAFPEHCPAPLVLWVTSLALPAISRLAPDLWHWRAATFDLCTDSPDLPVVEKLNRLVPRPDEEWQAQLKEDALRRVALLRRMLEEIGSDGGERRARLLIEFADVTERVGDYGASLLAAEEALAIARQLGDGRLTANAEGRAARILAHQGKPEGALALFQEALGIYESLGDVRSRAVTLGSIAWLKANRGEVEEALALHQEALGVYEELGDVRSRAVTLGDIARLKADRGAVEEALALHQEELGVYEELGDVRSRAVTLGDIARLKADRGAVEEALALHQEELGVYEELGDVRSRAVTLGDIARLKANHGAVEEALALHQEALGIYEELGDVQMRALTLGSIARLKANRGAVEEALALHQEALGIYEELGDRDGQANAHWSIALLRLRGPSLDNAAAKSALEALTFAYNTTVEIGRADGIAVVGLDLARLLARTGKPQEARALAERSLNLFVQLGRPDWPAVTQAFLDSLPPPDGEAHPTSAGAISR
ncbi:tetratricopeptide repeat protein [Azospirillum sp. sgz302134]